MTDSPRPAAPPAADRPSDSAGAPVGRARAWASFTIADGLMLLIGGLAAWLRLGDLAGLPLSPAEATAAAGARNRYGEDLRLAGGKTRQNEAGRFAAASALAAGQEAENRVLLEQLQEFPVGPGPDEILLVEARHGPRRVRSGRDNDIIPREEGGPAPHGQAGLRGRAKPSCGLASAARR